jgi:heme exporter protein A
MSADLTAGASATDPGDDAVHLRRMTRLYDGQPAVAHIQLRVERGENVWLRGTNGSGKSTLLRVIATAISPTFGEGTVLGYDLRRQRRQIRARVDLLGHQSRLYDDLTAIENLRFTCALYGLAERSAGAALDRVGLGDVADVRAASFSQGMRQRLALARCLMRGPALILLDEPYAGLDVHARVLVDDVLADARDHGRTVILASHEAPPEALVGREVHLDAGRVVQSIEDSPVRMRP